MREKKTRNYLVIPYYRILAKDDDITPEYNTVTYWLHPPQSHFIIGSSTGDIYLAAPLDYENRTKYELNVS